MYELKTKEACKSHIPTSFISEAITKPTHVVTNRRPFGAADNSNVFHGQDGEEQILISPVIPVLAIHVGF